MASKDKTVIAIKVKQSDTVVMEGYFQHRMYDCVYLVACSCSAKHFETEQEAKQEVARCEALPSPVGTVTTYTIESPSCGITHNAN